MIKMKSENKNVIELTEDVRLSYAHALKMYLQIHNEYRHIKFRTTDEEVQKKIPLLDKHFYDGTGKLKWDDIRTLLPPNLEENITKAYKMLTENEIRLCCLLLFDLNASEICDILPYKQDSVYVVTYRIKRKTGMKDITRSLNTFLFALE